MWFKVKILAAQHYMVSSVVETFKNKQRVRNLKVFSISSSNCEQKLHASSRSASWWRASQKVAVNILQHRKKEKQAEKGAKRVGRPTPNGSDSHTIHLQQTK